MQESQQLNRRKILCRASSRQRLLAGLVLSVVVISFGLFWLAANAKIDMGLLINPCGFKQRYGLPCPTCGMTTSVLTFVQGKIFESFYIQPVAALRGGIRVVVAFMGFSIAVFGVFFFFLRRFFTEVKIKHIILALIVIIAAGGAVTLARALAANVQ